MNTSSRLVLSVALLVAGFVCWLALVRPVEAQDKGKAVQKWEYAELHFYSIPGVAVGTNKPVPPTIDWVSGEGRVQSDGWKDMAEKLKAPSTKKDTAADEKGYIGSEKVEDVIQRFRVLNHLGEQGWELISRDHEERPRTTRWSFKRLVVK